MSNRLFQGLVHQMRDTIDATIGVVDENATIIACSELSKIGTSNEFVSLDLSDSQAFRLSQQTGLCGFCGRY